MCSYSNTFHFSLALYAGPPAALLDKHVRSERKKIVNKQTQESCHKNLKIQDSKVHDFHENKSRVQGKLPEDTPKS